MTPLEKYRQGLPVTLIDKARTCETLEELKGFQRQAVRSACYSREEYAEIARMVAEMEAQK